MQIIVKGGVKNGKNGAEKPDMAKVVHANHVVHTVREAGAGGIVYCFGSHVHSGPIHNFI
eukprot:2467820-Ditylum_brightwellii.AAC.1